MNPAALKVNVADLPKGATIIVNTDAFNERNLQKAGYESNPLEDGSLSNFHVHEVALSSITVEALKEVEGITSREAERSKNFFALGLVYWLYHRPVEGTLAFIETKFARRPEIAEANTRAFKAGWTDKGFQQAYERPKERITDFGLLSLLSFRPYAIGEFSNTMVNGKSAVTEVELTHGEEVRESHRMSLVREDDGWKMIQLHASIAISNEEAFGDTFSG
jgi:hypothetical protein